MKIGYFSDPHLDFYVKPNVSGDRAKFSRAITPHLAKLEIPDDLDVIVVAGDLGHYNHQTVGLLKELRKTGAKIVAVLGNHDMYLISKAQQVKYQHNSFNRVRELKEALKDEKDIYLLDRTTIEIDGVTFGGLPMWYNLSNRIKADIWASGFNDSRFILEGKLIRVPVGGMYSTRVQIKPTFNSQDFYNRQVASLATMKCDVLVTHVCPTLIPDYARDIRYRHSTMNFLYESDTGDLVEDTGANVCIFGHTHSEADFTDRKTNYLCNPVGYPGEKSRTKIKVIDYEKRDK